VFASAENLKETGVCLYLDFG